MYQETKVQSFRLESGFLFEELTIGFHTFGRLNNAKSNVIWVCHALTANSDVSDWWSGLFGEQRLFSPDQYFIVCANILGSCYGSTGPSHGSGEQAALLDEFPLVSTRDQARLFDVLRGKLEINQIHALIGASLGGQQALEWAIEYPNVISNLVLLATNARHSPWGIAFNESQRLAIQTDPTFGDGILDGGQQGLAVARSIAMLSYRSYEGYDKTQSESSDDLLHGFKAASYQRYQGEKLVRRFDAYSYFALTSSMDSHNVARGRGSIFVALGAVKARTLVIGISSDFLFPTHEQKFLSAHIPNADYVQIDSDYGHDGFLIESDQLAPVIADFLEGNYRQIRHTIFKNTVKKEQLINVAGLR